MPKQNYPYLVNFELNGTFEVQASDGFIAISKAEKVLHKLTALCIEYSILSLEVGPTPEQTARMISLHERIKQLTDPPTDTNEQSKEQV